MYKKIRYKDWLSVKEVAKIINKEPYWIKNLIYKDILPAIKHGRRHMYFINPKILEKFVEENEASMCMARLVTFAAESEENKKILKSYLGDIWEVMHPNY